MVSELLQKYLWLIQIFMRAGQKGLVLGTVQDLYERRWGEPYTRKSFCNHRNMVYDIFGINIDCRRNDNHYFIDTKSSENNTTSYRWMLDSLTTGTLAELRSGQLKGRISLQGVPSGKSWLAQLSGAMQSNVAVEIAYRKYSGNDTSAYTIRPYALKENAQRWYLVGWCEQRSQTRVYALDRIMSVETTNDTFEMPEGFDVDELFSNCFGVYLPDEGSQPVRLVFRVTESESKYLLDLPIHESQREISRGGGKVTFAIDVHPNRDLMMQLLSRGESLEVLEPADIREQIYMETKKTSQLYEQESGRHS